MALSLADAFGPGMAPAWAGKVVHTAPVPGGEAKPAVDLVVTEWREANRITVEYELGAFLKKAHASVRTCIGNAERYRAWLGLMLLSVRPRFKHASWEGFLINNDVKRNTANRAIREALECGDELGLCTIAELVGLYNACPHRRGGVLTAAQFVSARNERRAERTEALRTNALLREDDEDGDEDRTETGPIGAGVHQLEAAPVSGRVVQPMLFSDEQLRGALVVRRQVWSERVKREAIDAARAAEVEHAFRVLEREFGGVVGAGQGRAETAGQRGTGRRHGAGTRTS